ncbi:MAG: PDZ domain-containing protein [Planctomycetes bacterium]|nr:PDZ domain-containing protein [Planctomycetota bacterium]
MRLDRRARPWRLACLFALAACAAPPPPSALDHVAALVTCIEERFDPPLERRVIEEAVRAALLAQLDPYSEYLDPATDRWYRQSLAGHFGGVGLRVAEASAAEGWPLQGALHGSPAARLGLRDGDVLTAVDGQPVATLSFDELLDRLRGEVGTLVTLDVRRAGAPPPERFEVERARIELPTVVGARRLPDGRFDHRLADGRLAYLRITSFGATTAAETEAALAAGVARGAQGFVLDLRTNIGGLLQAALATADLLVEEGVLVTLVGRGGTESRCATAGVVTRLPIVLLIGPQTVSSGEVFAAALQDRGRACIAGSRSFGKGHVQELLALRDGSGTLKLTTERWQRPNGGWIERHAKGGDPERGGVWPDADLALPQDPAVEQQRYHALVDRDLAATLASATPIDLLPAGDELLARACAALLAPSR